MIHPVSTAGARPSGSGRTTSRTLPVAPSAVAAMRSSTGSSAGPVLKPVRGELLLGTFWIERQSSRCAGERDARNAAADRTSCTEVRLEGVHQHNLLRGALDRSGR